MILHRFPPLRQGIIRPEISEVAGLVIPFDTWTRRSILEKRVMRSRIAHRFGPGAPVILVIGVATHLIASPIETSFRPQGCVVIGIRDRISEAALLILIIVNR